MRTAFHGLMMLAMASGAAAAIAQTPQPVQRQVRRVAAPPVRVEGVCAAVPMTIVNNIPVVEVTIGGRGPYRFAIDTGAAGHGRISAALARTLGLATVGEARTPAPGGTTEARPIYGAGPIALGGVTFSDAGLLALSAVRGPEPGWDGILGIGMFADLTLTLDYGNGVAMVSRAPLTDGVTATFDNGIPDIPIEIAERTFHVDLDTGNGAGGLFLTEAAARSLPLAGAPVERGQARTSFGTFAILEAPLGAPVTVGGQALQWRQVGWPAVRGEGNLGSRALAGMTLSVDQRGGRVKIAASGARPGCG